MSMLPYQMNWGQRGNEICLEFVSNSIEIDVKKIDISLTDRSCFIMFNASINTGWDFFQEVQSKKARRYEVGNKLVLMIPKQDPCIKWLTFKKRMSQQCLPRKVSMSNIENQPPHKIPKSPYPLEPPDLSSVANGDNDTNEKSIVMKTITDSYDNESMKLKIESIRTLPLNELIEISDVKYEIQDLNCDDIVLISLSISDIDPWGVYIEFEEFSMAVKFKTGDKLLHEKYNATLDSVFLWKFQLRSAIVPSKCSFRVSFQSLEIEVKKKKAEMWRVVSPASLPGGARIQSPSKSVKITDGTRPDHKEVTDAPPQTTVTVIPTRYPCGFTGLDNLGNSCFMNSVIQFLANTPEIKEIFLSGKYKHDINVTNPLGAGGRLATVFHAVLTKLWQGEVMSYAPIKLKSIVASRDSQFYGCLQHDAQEFMAYFLDGLHEDINRVKVKPYNTKTHELDGRADDEIATKAWQMHLARNDSYIVDYFHGQFKSKLVCPDCNKTSITFDPFLFLPVPLPKPMRTLNIFYFGSNADDPPTKISVRVNKDITPIRNVLAEVAKITNDRPEQLRIFQSKESRIQKIFSIKSNIGYIAKTDILSVFHSDLVCTSPVQYISVIQRHNSTVVPRMCTNCHKLSSSLIQIRRCTNCLRVGYCSRECQRSDWNSHKLSCSRLEATGVPFMISIPSTRINYTTLCSIIWHRARHSIEVKGDIFQSFLSRINGEDGIDCNNKPTDFPFTITPVKLDKHLTTTKPTFKCLLEEEVDLTGVDVVTVDWQNHENNGLVVEGKPLICHEGNETSNDKTLTLDDCVQLFMEPEVLAPEEAWYCSKCKEHKQATKKLSLWKLPDTLIIQLKRFSFRNAIWRDKLDTLVDFPIKSLNMQKYCLPEDSCDESHLYDLFAVINHHGGILGGHYTTCVRLPHKHDSSKDELGWRLCDDNRVTKISEQQVVTRSAYVMAYRRRYVNGKVPKQPMKVNFEESETSQNDAKPSSPVDYKERVENTNEKSELPMETSDDVTPANKTSVTFSNKTPSLLQGSINFNEETMLGEKDVFGSEEMTPFFMDGGNLQSSDSQDEYTDMYAID